MLIPTHFLLCFLKGSGRERMYAQGRSFRSYHKNNTQMSQEERNKTRSFECVFIDMNDGSDWNDEPFLPVTTVSRSLLHQIMGCHFLLRFDGEGVTGVTGEERKSFPDPIPKRNSISRIGYKRQKKPPILDWVHLWDEDRTPSTPSNGVFPSRYLQENQCQWAHDSKKHLPAHWHCFSWRREREDRYVDGVARQEDGSDWSHLGSQLW